MEELSTDSSAPEPRYDVYFSYRKTDEQREAEISRCLLAVIPDFHGFDDFDFIPGRYVITQRENALAASGSVAVLCGPDGPSQMAVDELSHAFQLSMGQGTPVFPVYLPDWNGDVPEWLRHRSPVDLQHQFDGDRLLRDGLVAMIAAVQKMKIRDADRWLSEREPPPPGPSARPPELRALVVGIQHYQHYPELPSAASDMQQVEQLLRSTNAADGGQWDIVHCPEHPTERQLAETARTFFSAVTGHEDTLLFYFSGHGAVDESHELYLVVGETRTDDPYTTALPIKALASYVKSSKSRRKLVLLDCCFSGEASDRTDWGPGTAVFMTSRQAVPASAGPSQFTEAIVAAWEDGAGSTGDLHDGLNGIVVHVNQKFDRGIPLPRVEGGGPWPAADSLPSLRLSFNEAGELNVSLPSSRTPESVPCPEMADWFRSQRHWIISLIDSTDVLISLAPPDKFPTETIKQNLSTIGTDLLSSSLTTAVRARFGEELDAWPELRLQLSFDDRWIDRGPIERLPWESVMLCRDHNRAVSLERIVPAKATKSGARRRPTRVIAWNAFTEAEPRYATGARHLLTHLLQAELAREPHAVRLVVKEPAFWTDLFQASRSGTVGVPDLQHRAGDTEQSLTSDFDTFLLFAPVSIVDGEPRVSFSDERMAPFRASDLLKQLQQWALSYLIIETIAGEAAPRPAPAGSPARSLQATTQLAAMLADQLGVTVVAVCHPPSFTSLARPAEGEETPFIPSFSGQFLRQLADHSMTVHAAAQEARHLIIASLNREDYLDVGLPVVCRPEPKPAAPQPGRMPPLVGPVG
jgi:hypothetical protein